MSRGPFVGEVERRQPVFRPVAVLTMLLAIALAEDYPSRSVAVRIWLVGIGLVALRIVVERVVQVPRSGGLDRFDRAAAGPPPPPVVRPVSRRAADTLVTLAAGSVGDLHFRVRPAMREIASQRLAANHGVDLEAPRDAQRAATLCGPVLWDIVRPDRPVPPVRNDPGLDHAAVASVIDRLEAL